MSTKFDFLKAKKLRSTQGGYQVHSKYDSHKGFILYRPFDFEAYKNILIVVPQIALSDRIELLLS